MKLKFTKRPKSENWLPTFSKEFLLSWLHVNDIWPDSKHATIEYNKIYNFYDIVLFPHPDNRRDTNETLAKQIAYLAKKERFRLDYMDIYYWRWENNKTIKGIRFWINAI